MRKERKVGWKLEKSMKIRLEFGCPLYNGEVVASVWKVVELGGKKDYFLLKLLMDDSQDNQSTFLDFQLALYSLVNTVNLGNTV